jgi:hypothetical protein
MTYTDEFRSDHDRYMKRLLARLALYADEPFPKTNADCRRLIARRGRMLAPWQLDTLMRRVDVRIEPENNSDPKAAAFCRNTRCDSQYRRAK